ncbi:MAG: hypothetical protein Q7U01_00425 [Pseudomonas sp.]|nr:hypothetical protein [Pseudomonas sp.]
MSNPSKAFECHWQASRWLLAGYLLTLIVALLALVLAALPLWAQLLGGMFALLHAAWVVPRQILLVSPQAFTGLRHDAAGWQLFNAALGWQVVQLRPSSLALPLVVVLHFRLAGECRVRGLCIPCDALKHDQHRRLRLQLKFSRRRWAALK